MEDKTASSFQNLIEHIQSEQLCRFAYDSYLRDGAGCCAVFFPAKKNDKSGSRHLTYIPCDSSRFPVEASRFLDYDPAKNLVLVYRDATRVTVALRLGEEQLGISPLKAYEKWQAEIGREARLSDTTGEQQEFKDLSI